MSSNPGDSFQHRLTAICAEIFTSLGTGANYIHTKISSLGNSVQPHILHKFLEQGQMIFEGRIPKKTILHIGSFHNAFHMEKGVIASFTVIFHFAALSHTPEAQIGVSQVDDGIIYTSAAKGSFADGLGFMVLASGKYSHTGNNTEDVAAAIMALFQSTLPYWERLSNVICAGEVLAISIHAPILGAT